MNQRFVIALFAVSLAGCASAPNPGVHATTVDGWADITVRVEGWVLARGDAEAGAVPLQRLRELDAVECVLSNDKGAWTLNAPATVRIQLSDRPLQVECRKQGFKTASDSIACAGWGVSSRGAPLPIVTGLMILSVPLAVAVAPYAPHLAANVAGNVLLHGAAAVGEHAKASPRCVVEQIGLIMTPAEGGEAQ